MRANACEGVGGRTAGCVVSWVFIRAFTCEQSVNVAEWRSTAMKVRTELATAALVGGKFRRGVRGAKHTRSKKQGGKSKGGRANPLSNALRGNSYRVMCLSSE